MTLIISKDGKNAQRLSQSNFDKEDYLQQYIYNNPDAVPAQAHIQVADRIGWMAEAHSLPAFERYPPQDE